MNYVLKKFDRIELIHEDISKLKVIYVFNVSSSKSKWDNEILIIVSIGKNELTHKNEFKNYNSNDK